MSSREFDDKQRMRKIVTDAEKLALKFNTYCLDGQSLSAVILAVVALSEQHQSKHPDLYAEALKFWSGGFSKKQQ